VKPLALEVYDPGDRITVAVSMEDTGDSERADDEPPTAIIVTGLEHPSLRPFLHEALLRPTSYADVSIAKILLFERDTSAIPYLRVALKNRKDAYRAELAAALALLGDSVGNTWIHAALLDTLHSAGTLDTAEKIHSFTFEAAAKLRDPQNVSRLLELSTHPVYGFSATWALLEYRSSEIAERLLARLVRQKLKPLLARFLETVKDPTFPMTDSLRDSVNKAAQLLER
jgi:hypothetical protein